MAYFHMGFTYEFNVGTELTSPGVSSIRVEGNEIPLVDPPDGKKRVSAGDAHRRAKEYITASEALPNRKQKSDEHLDEARKGAKAWNLWRREHPDIQPMFANTNFSELGLLALDDFDFSYANFTQAVLKQAHLERANLHQAVLAGADLTGAQLQGANFCRADLYETVLNGADLTGANLQGVQMVGNPLHGTILNGCTAYGASAWDLEFDERTWAERQRVLIKYKVGGDGGEEQQLAVQGLDVAAFLYATLNNKNISRIIDAAAKRWVLILGSFTGRKATLETIRDTLAKDFIPIIFDFPKAPERDLIEQLIVMAGMSRFVVVEITDPRSAALELYAIATTFGVPVFPFLESESEPFGMYSGLSRFRWVKESIRYTDRDLVAKLEQQVIQPELARQKT